MEKKAQFNKILKWVLHNPYSSFYYKKYAGLKDLHFISLPFLTRKEIANIDSKEAFFVPIKKVSTLNSSSGTSSQGSPLIVPKLAHDDPAMVMLEKILNKVKVQKLLVLANISVANNRLSYLRTHPDFSKNRPVILGDIYNFNLSALMIKTLAIDAIETSPTILSLFIPFLKEVYDLAKIKFIGLGGEYTSEQKYKFLRSYFKNAYFHFRFGGTENPVIKGFRCEYLSNQPPRFFHPNTDFYIYEVIDSEDKEVKKKEKGELVLTTLKKCAFPLIRYKTGDAIAYLTNKCPCGRKDQIEVFGRIGYDFIRIAGFTIHTEMLDKALISLDPTFVNKYQLHVYEVIEKNRLLPKLILNLNVAKMAKKNMETLTREIEARLYLSPTMTLKELKEKGLIMPLEIKFEKEEKKGHKSVKIVSHVN